MVSHLENLIKQKKASFLHLQKVFHFWFRFQLFPQLYVKIKNRQNIHFAYPLGIKQKTVQIAFIKKKKNLHSFVTVTLGQAEILELDPPSFSAFRRYSLEFKSLVTWLLLSFVHLMKAFIPLHVLSEWQNSKLIQF